jgi:hypothetical protein
MKSEEKLAQELDAFLTAQMKGERPLPLPDNLGDEANLAANLLNLAAATKPDPDFLTHLEARLVRAARAAPGGAAAPPPSAWQKMLKTLEETFTMKKTMLAIGALAALFIVGYFALNGWQNSAAPISDTIADAPPAAVVPAEEVAIEPTAVPTETPTTTTPEVIAAIPVEEPTPLPRPTLDPGLATKLPGLGNASGISMGLGGGGGGDLSTMPIGEMPVWDPLGETEFVLTAVLPTNPTALTLFAQPGQGIYTAADAARLAALLGLSGPVYRDTLPPDMPPDVVLPPVYFVFDGPRTLAVREDGFYYYDQSAAPGFYAEMASYAQAAPTAEAFLLERGLLDFPYEMRPTAGGNDVEFRRVVNGRSVNLAEFFVSVTNQGEVMAVSNQPLTQLADLGDYPLRSAAEAWQQVITDGLDYQEVSFITYPGPNWVPPVEEPYTDPYADQYQSWQRSYGDGDPITIYPYPSVHVAVDGQSPPRIQADQYLLLGSDEMLRAIAPYAYQQIRVTGTVRQSDTLKAIELLDWEPVDPESFQFLPGLPGTIRRSSDEVRFVSDGGETFTLDQPPADIADGERAYLYGWRTVDAAGQPGINWMSLDRIIEYEPIGEEPHLEPIPWEPFRVNQATIDRVDLVYVFTPIFDETYRVSQFIIQPAWRFSGLTDAGEIIEIFVQAVRPEYVQPSTD